MGWGLRGWGGGFFPAVLQGSLEVSQGGGGTTFPPQADIHPTPLTRREHVTTCATNVHLRKTWWLYILFFSKACQEDGVPRRKQEILDSLVYVSACDPESMHRRTTKQINRPHQKQAPSVFSWGYKSVFCFHIEILRTCSHLSICSPWNAIHLNNRKWVCCVPALEWRIPENGAQTSVSWCWQKCSHGVLTYFSSGTVGTLGIICRCWELCILLIYLFFLNNAPLEIPMFMPPSSSPTAPRFCRHGGKTNTCI